MEYLSAEEIRGRSEACRAEMERLFSTKAIVGKPSARQWRFFSDAVKRLLEGNSSSEFDALSKVQAAQLKFEVEDKLRRFYLRSGHTPNLVFALAHESEIASYGIQERDPYPKLAGYSVLVRDLTQDRIGETSASPEDLSLYLETVVTGSIDAEFAAYAALPEIRLEEVGRYFCAGSPAYREIANLVARHRQRGWVISNPMNPSTKRLLDIKVRRVGDSEAMVSTKEYWYLRWWTTREKSYVYPYRETNRQLYVLHRQGDVWRVFQNLRPPPRSSVPGRWRSKRPKTESEGGRSF